MELKAIHTKGICKLLKDTVQETITELLCVETRILTLCCAEEGEEGVTKKLQFNSVQSPSSTPDFL